MTRDLLFGVAIGVIGTSAVALLLARSAKCARELYDEGTSSDCGVTGCKYRNGTVQSACKKSEAFVTGAEREGEPIQGCRRQGTFGERHDLRGFGKGGNTEKSATESQKRSANKGTFGKPRVAPWSLDDVPITNIGADEDAFGDIPVDTSIGEPKEDLWSIEDVTDDDYSCEEEDDDEEFTLDKDDELTLGNGFSEDDEDEDEDSQVVLKGFEDCASGDKGADGKF